MDFTHDGDSLRTGGGGNAGMLGLLAGSMMNRDDDRGKTSTMMIVLAVIFFVIIFIIAIIALAMFNRDHKREIPVDYYANKSGNLAELLAGIAAAKSMDNGYKHGEIDKLEIMQKLEHNEDRTAAKLEHSEDRAVARQTQAEIGALGLMMTKTMADNEKDNLKEFGDIKNSLGQLTMGVHTLLTERNNAAIIQGVVNQLLVGKPCLA